jgi:hypothetical protein
LIVAVFEMFSFINEEKKVRRGQRTEDRGQRTEDG